MLEVVALTWRLAAEVKAPTRPSGPSFSLLYRGGPACPTRANFEAAILARAPGSRSVAEGQEADVRFDAEPATRASEKGRLRVALEDGTSQDREIDADDCAEAVQSMAIIAAMILASREASAPESRAEPTAPSTSPPAATPSPAPQKAGPEPSTVTVEGPTTVSPSPPKPVDTARREPQSHLLLGAVMGLESGAAPDLTPTGGVFVDLSRASQGSFVPSLRLDMLLGTAAHVKTPAGTARLQAAVARLHGCALRVASGAADARLCAVLDGGALMAEGLDALHHRSSTMFWFGSGLGGLAGWRLGSRWSLELAAGLRVLWNHDEFIFSPNTPVHQVPVFAWNSQLGLGYRVW